MINKHDVMKREKKPPQIIIPRLLRMDAGHFDVQPHLVTRKLIFPWGEGGKVEEIIYFSLRGEGRGNQLR